MLTWIALILIAAIALLVHKKSMPSEKTENTIGTVITGVIAGAFFLGLIWSAVHDSTDIDHKDISNVTYTVADGSKVNVNDYSKVQFFYKDGEDLKSYRESAKSVIIDGAGKTVQVRETEYHTGTVVLPWDTSRVDTFVTVK